MSSIFLQLAHKVISEEKRPLSTPEIWEIAQAKGYDKDLPTKGKTPSASLGAMLYVDVRDNPNSEFISTDDRPKKFILRSLVNTLGIKVLDIPTPITQKKIEYLEKELHPFLVILGFII